MKDIFNPQTIEEFKVRIQKLNAGSQAQWGKMNVYQMVKHSTGNEQMLLRNKQFKRLFIGRLFGKMALKSNIKDNAPLSKNSPTHPDLVIKENGDVERQKKIWMSLLEQYPKKASSDYKDFVHPFFGKMDSKQVSRFAYKHIDHHLQQFGV
ncbi:MAG: DUF1569 domain-containing protein [Chitinophagales bacterium]